MVSPAPAITLALSQRTTRTWSLDDDLAFVERAGIDGLGVELAKLDASGDATAAARRLRDAAPRITSLTAPGPFTLDQPERWPTEREGAGRIMDLALELRPDVLVLTTGPAGALAWERAADNLAEILQGTVLEAEREGLALALAPTPAGRRDLGFVSTLYDAVELGWRLDIGACLEVTTCWSERNLAGTIGAATERIGLVRVADGPVDGSEGDEQVPGDGSLPLTRVLHQLRDAGYAGVVELAAAGAAVDAEGYDAAIERGLTHLAVLLGADPAATD